jgi:CheY-like chemotaxis protein
LSIVQRLVTLLDLKLDVQSQVGKGSVFTLTLPTGDSALLPGPLGPELAVDAGQLTARVLLLEDDPAVLSATRMLLKSEGHHVTGVATIADALEQVRVDPRIDVLITDYHLGAGETGTQAIASLRAALNRPLKAVLLTGDTSSAIKDLPRDPLLRIVSKPVNADELLSLLRELMDS